MSMTGKQQRMIAMGDVQALGAAIAAGGVGASVQEVRRIQNGDKQSVDAILNISGTGPVSQSMDEDDWPILAQNLVGRV